MKLYQDHIKSEPELEACEWLDQNGYNVDVIGTRIVPSESSDKCYVVQRVQTTSVPFERADVAADRVELVLCSCDSGRYHSFESVDIEQSLDGFSTCKHGLKAFRAEKHKADANQGTLL